MGEEKWSPCGMKDLEQATPAGFERRRGGGRERQLDLLKQLGEPAAWHRHVSGGDLKKS